MTKVWIVVNHKAPVQAYRCYSNPQAASNAATKLGWVDTLGLFAQNPNLPFTTLDGKVHVSVIPVDIEE